MLNEMIKDPNGNVSATRVGFIGILVAFFGTWAYLSIHKGEMQPIDMEQLMMVLGAFGFKVAQRTTEGKEVAKDESRKVR